MAVGDNSRRAAAFALARWLQTRDFPQTLLPDSGPDRAFVQDLVYTAIRRRRALEAVLRQLVAHWPKGELEAILYVGAAQILYHPEIPDFAAVHETVEAAKASGRPGIVRTVNGVLRNLIRRRDELDKMLAASPVAVRESFPDPLYRRWERRFGTADAERLAQWHNQSADTYLAWRPGAGPAADAVGAAVRFERLAHGQRVETVPGYAEGEFIVQDPATAAAVELLAVRPGETVLDACAAPGGKTIQLAWRGAAVTACEVNPRRRRRLEENLQRTRVAAQVIGELPAAAQFEAALVDAPCSNTGVLRRRPDARWNWSESAMAALVKLQAEILEAVAVRVRPGGRLVYSTCSNESEENQRQLENFLARHSDWELMESRESLPFQSGHDGAFAALLQRRLAN